MVTLLTGFVHPFVVEAGRDQPRFRPADSDADRSLCHSARRPWRHQADDHALPTYEAHPDVSADGYANCIRARPCRRLPRLHDGDRRRGGGRLTTAEVHEDGPLWIPGADTISYWSVLGITGRAPQPTSRPAPAPGPTANPRPVDLTGLGIWTVGSAGGAPQADQLARWRGHRELGR